jgi:endoglucanase
MDFSCFSKGGRYKIPIGPTDMAVRTEQRLQPFLTWLTRHHQRGAIGEIGVSQDDPRWLPALSKFLDMTDATCLDWFMWAGGGRRENHELALEPINGQDRPQIKLLRSRL